MVKNLNKPGKKKPDKMHLNLLMNIIWLEYLKNYRDGSGF